MEAAERSFVYEMFASLYSKEPDRSTLSYFLSFIREFATQFPSDAALQLMEITAQYHEKVVMAKDDSWLAEMRQDYYDHLFVPSSGRYVPPFESAVMSQTLWGPETVHCASCYEDLDFDPARLNIFEPMKEIAIPDHLGYQLAFMAFLTKRESQCAASEAEAGVWRNLQAEFCRQHLASWLPAYSSTVAGCGIPFYQALAAVVAEFVRHDLAALENCQMRGDLN